jgi:tryptophanase
VTTLFEPFKIKCVEPIRVTTRQEREAKIQQAGYNPFLLRADDVLIDLLTDSGTSAMSAAAWAAMLEGDESYAGARSWFHFESTIKEIFGFKHVIPTHQGRAAERILFGVMVKPRQYVINNTHFDTTRGNIEYLGARAVDLVCAEGKDPGLEAPFKGNADLDAVERAILEFGAQNVPLLMITVTNNSGGGQPVSMSNIRGMSQIAHKHGIPFFIDACRFAENCWFIKQREEGYAEKTVKEIAREMFSYADGCTMSAKKDAFANIGGFLCFNDDAVAKKAQELLIVTEGYPTYGGLAGRDLDAIAVGLREVLEASWLEYRIGTTTYMADKLTEAGVPVVRPAGGHAVYLDGRGFCPHVPQLQYPAWSLSVELYKECGVRAVEIGTVMFGYDPETGNEKPSNMDLVRLALPRRVYTRSHMDYVIEGIKAIHARRESVRGMKIVEAPKFLRHFTARLDYV